MLTFEEIEFLRESNNIEDIWDDRLLEQAIFAWQYLTDQKELSPSVIKKTHKILMLHQPLAPDEKGYYRRVPVYIGGREAPHYTTIPSSINSWCKRANLQTKHPGSRIEEDIKHQHVGYERIHPFIDGNGRTGRLFMNWQRVRAGLPILVIKESEKREYYKWFTE